MTLYKSGCQLDRIVELLDHLVDPHPNLLLVFLFASTWAARRVSHACAEPRPPPRRATRRTAFHSSTDTARLLCATSSALTVVSAASASSNAREYSHRFLPTCDFVYGHYRYSASCSYVSYSTDDEAIIGEYQDDDNALRGGRSDASDGIDACVHCVCIYCSPYPLAHPRPTAGGTFWDSGSNFLGALMRG